MDLPFAIKITDAFDSLEEQKQCDAFSADTRTSNTDASTF